MSGQFLVRDFYVNGNNCWGIELLREGSEMKEHAERFARGGQYEDIPLKEWAIVDFRHHSRLLENYVPISGTYFTRRITKRLLSSALNDDQPIILRGDDSLVGFL
jgi:hypothetical protein